MIAAHASIPVLDGAFVARAVRGRLLGGSPMAAAKGVSSDTRDLPPGALFVALRGPHFDAHGMLEQTTHAGGLLLDEAGLEAYPEAVAMAARAPFAVVAEDTGDALLALGAAWLRALKARTVAITGSSGKTTTKDLARTLLGPAGVGATVGNFNNRVGLPLSVLRAPRGIAIFVAELGISGLGEMDELAQAAAPEVAVLTGVHEAHVAGLIDRAQTLAEKARIFAHLRGPQATAILPHDLAQELRPALGRAHRVWTFGAAPPADAFVVASRWDGSVQRAELEVLGSRLRVELPLPGRHNLQNLLAAILVVRALGRAPDLDALRSFQPAAHRSVLRTVGALRVLDDCYNANPQSMRAALRTARELAEGSGFHAVLGTMLELGPGSAAAHEGLGRQAALAGVRTLVALGTHGEATVSGFGSAGRALATSDPSAAADFITASAGPGDLVLLKGSRGAHVERVLDALEGLAAGEG